MEKTKLLAMKSNVKFMELLEIIIETNGNPSVKQVLSTGYTIEHFIKMANKSREGLYNSAKMLLKTIKEV